MARHLNFTRAARELHLSQPFASMQIQQLVEELGAPLFEKVGKRVYLSEAGKVLEGYVHRVMALLEEAQEAIGELKGLQRGHLHVGVSTTPGVYLLPRIMVEFKARYPGIEVFLEIANTRRVEEKILRNEIDLGFVGGELEVNGKVKAEPYLTDELILMAAPGHPLAGRGEIRPEELSGAGLILREPGSATRELALKALEGLKIEVRTAMELGNPEAVKQRVAAGLGVSFVSRFSVLSEIAERKLVAVPVRGLALKRPLFILSHCDKRPLPLAVAFLECARASEGLLQ